MKNIINALSIGGDIEITIYDCGTGPAKFIGKSENKIKIEINEEMWTTCYPNQSLVTNILDIRIEDIFSITKK